MTTRELLAEINQLINQGGQGILKARPLLELWSERFGESNEEFVLESRPRIAWLLVLSNVYGYVKFINSDNQEEANGFIGRALDLSKDFVANYPESDKVPEAYKIIVRGKVNAGELEGAFVAYEDYLGTSFGRNPNFKSVGEEMLRSLLLSAYMKRLWKKGKPYFEAALQDPNSDANTRSLSVVALVESMMDENKDPQDIERFVPYLLTRSLYRYEPRFNIALLKFAGELANEKKYSRALIFYRLVFTPQDIRDYYDLLLHQLKRQKEEVENILSFGASENAYFFSRLTSIEGELENLQLKVKNLAGVKDYAKDLVELLGRAYFLAGRYWESYQLYHAFVQDNPKHPRLETLIYLEFLSASQVGLDAEGIVVGEKYLSRRDWKRYRAEIGLYLADTYLRQKQYSQAIRVGRDFMELSPKHDGAENVLSIVAKATFELKTFKAFVKDCEIWIKEASPSYDTWPALNYWLGVGLATLGDFSRCIPYFNVIVEKYSSTVYYQDSLYRRALAFVGENDFEKSKADFLTYIKNWPKDKLLPRVHYFLAISHTGNGDFHLALKSYRKVVAIAKEKALIRDAYMGLGTLLESQQKYLEALGEYQAFLKTKPTKNDAAQALYRVAQIRLLMRDILQALATYREIIENYGNIPTAYEVDLALSDYTRHYHIWRSGITAALDFLKTLKKDASLRQKFLENRTALFAYLAERREIPDEAKRPLYDKEFRERIVEDPAALNEILKQYQSLEDAWPSRTPAEYFRYIQQEALGKGQLTLVGRAIWAFDQASRLSGAKKQGALGAKRGFVDYKSAAPSYLLFLGQEALKAEKYPEAIRFFEALLRAHPDSKEAFLAILGLGDTAAAKSDFPLATRYYRRASSAYPTDSRVEEAYIREGDAEVALGRYDSGREKYQVIYSSRGVPAPIRAKATFKAGLSYYKEGAFSKTASFLPRIFFVYPTELEWCAKAYLYVGKSYERLGDIKKAKLLYQKYLNNPAYKSLPQTIEIKKAKEALP